MQLSSNEADARTTAFNGHDWLQHGHRVESQPCLTGGQIPGEPSLMMLVGDAQVDTSDERHAQYSSLTMTRRRARRTETDTTPIPRHHEVSCFWESHDGRTVAREDTNLLPPASAETSPKRQKYVRTATISPSSGKRTRNEKQNRNRILSQSSDAVKELNSLTTTPHQQATGSRSNAGARTMPPPCVLAQAVVGLSSS